MKVLLWEASNPSPASCICPTSKQGLFMTYRVYFNRWNDAPLIWSVDEGAQETERNVREVHFENVSGRTCSGPGDNVKSPTVWIEVEAQLRIHNDVATFRPPLRLARTRAA